jgi:2-keto-4-pentenoate hydratase
MDIEINFCDCQGKNSQDVFYAQVIGGIAMPEGMEGSHSAVSEKIRTAADALWDARVSRRPIGRVSSDYGIDMLSAYAVQDINRQRSIADGCIPCGWKIGLTSPATQVHFGVSEPDYGALFQDMGFAQNRELPISQLIQPRGETEIALVLKHGLTDPDIDLQMVIDAIDYVTVAVEIVDSAIENWDLTAADTIADNASAAMFVLGETRVPPGRVDAENVKMRTTCNGTEVSTGIGSNCMGNPYCAALWLMRALVDAGTPVQKGEVILTGALGPMYALAAGDTIAAHVEGLGSVPFNMST